MAKKKLRLFRCKCNHALRYGTSTCSYCFSPTPWRNRIWFPVLPVALVALAVLYLSPLG